MKAPGRCDGNVARRLHGGRASVCRAVREPLPAPDNGCYCRCIHKGPDIRDQATPARNWLLVRRFQDGREIGTREIAKLMAGIEGREIGRATRPNPAVKRYGYVFDD